jgi:integrase
VNTLRGSREKSFIESGFKNSDALGAVKEHPMLPPVFEVLKQLHSPGARGLIFKPAGLEFFSYSQIQNAYNRAFKAAGLPYRSTHVMRHGGTRKTFDETGGDTGIAQQHLGNRDRKTVDVYAVRSASAFGKYAETKWDECERRVAVGGNKWQQSPPHLHLVQEFQDDL